MKKFFVLQFRTDKSLAHERRCILKSGHLNESEVLFFNVLNQKTKLPKIKDLNNCKGLILGGSGQVDISHWSEANKTKVLRIESLLKEVIKRDLPTLSICFGHQLFAYILGSEVQADPNQAETGACEILLNKEGVKSRLFKGIPASFWATEGHKDCADLPKGAKILASSKKCKNQSYQLKNNIYCIQFHPELGKEDVRFRLNLFPRYANGKSSSEILKSYRPTPFAAKVLMNFKEVCLDNDKI